MFPSGNHTDPAKTTPAKLVLPFYLYAALSFLTAAILLLISVKDFTGHFFNPHILAITHIMALGWCTMVILGASHQLVPVIIEGSLYSPFLAMSSFILAAIGIPVLVYGFYQFNMGWPARLGGILIVLALLSYAVNLGLSISKSGKDSVQSSFILSASLWLLITTIVGLLLVYNFTKPLLQRNSVEYLSFHAHIGIVGWFLLLVIGVGSRLIPMFLISKYQNNGILWWIFGLVNGGLLAFAGFFLNNGPAYLFFIPLFMILAGVFLFIYYCYQAYRERIRKKVDDPMKL
jgi:cbb3-type cytochrome oxidase subunit 1